MRIPAAICTALLLAAHPAAAVMDDAHSFAMQAAETWVAQGVELRYDYPRGTLQSGGKATASFQVFKGNEYWFFAGGGEDGVKLNLTILDPDGTPVSVTTTQGVNSTTSQFTAPRTMMVRIEITGNTPDGIPFDWAVVYGFRPSRSTPPPPQQQE